MIMSLAALPAINTALAVLLIAAVAVAVVAYIATRPAPTPAAYRYRRDPADQGCPLRPGRPRPHPHHAAGRPGPLVRLLGLLRARRARPVGGLPAATTVGRVPAAVVARYAHAGGVR